MCVRWLAQQLTVALPDGSTYPATLVGADPSTDLAVLKVDGKNLPIGRFGDSQQLQVGDWVVAIGNALALPGGPTVSAGVVSALGRTVQEPGQTDGGQGPYLFDVIQTDAPINPGNSGGPLIDLQGEVVGINTLVAGQAEPGVQAQGIGFAISIASARPIVDQLVATGHAVHPYLGVQQIALNPVIANRLGTTAKSRQDHRQPQAGRHHRADCRTRPADRPAQGDAGRAAGRISGTTCSGAGKPIRLAAPLHTGVFAPRRHSGHGGAYALPHLSRLRVS